MAKIPTISIIKRKKCFGCYACVNACSINCISMEEDEEGFRYPIIHKERCIHCGSCLNACPSYRVKYDDKTLKNPMAYSTYAADEDICKQSSSGGIFSVIAGYILAKNGIVFGAISPQIDYVKHIKVSSIEELSPVRRSKYLQSDIGLTYRETELALKYGKDVLYTGTPCQIAGLRSFLRKDYNTLITCDLVCMGVPSTAIFRKFLDEMEYIYKSKPVSYYRDKSKGWAPSVFTMQFENRSSISLLYEKNIYNHGFKAHLFQRPTCSMCKFALIPRIGDITLGDDWDYYGRFKDQYEKLQRGVSYISINTEKGQYIFEQIKADCAGLEIAKLQLSHQIPHNFSRRSFFRYIKTHHVLESIEKFINHKSIYIKTLEKVMSIYYLTLKIIQLSFTKEGRARMIRKILLPPPPPPIS